MLIPRPAAERGETRTSWLESKHTFSFNRYYDPNFMGFRSLRVINDDRVAPGGKFGTHPHDNMEIITYVLDGSVVHEDSTGAKGQIRPGDAQRMSAGTGIWHSEANGSATEPVHFLQIWIEPSEAGLKPGYEQKSFPEEERRNRFRLIAASNGRDGAVTIHQDADLYTALLEEGMEVKQSLAAGRSGWLQVAKGEVTVNGVTLSAGDGAAIREEGPLTVQARKASEVLLFDLG